MIYLVRVPLREFLTLRSAVDFLGAQQCTSSILDTQKCGVLGVAGSVYLVVSGSVYLV